MAAQHAARHTKLRQGGGGGGGGDHNGNHSFTEQGENIFFTYVYILKQKIQRESGDTEELAHVCVCVHIYIYIERRKKQMIWIYRGTGSYVYIYIYILKKKNR
jgi:hypothetical protein